jgi:hypothetical protein
MGIPKHKWAGEQPKIHRERKPPTVIQKPKTVKAPVPKKPPAPRPFR